MTDTRDRTQLDAAIEEVVGRIDQELGRLTKRDLVSSTEVSDLLLDVRMLLVPVTAVPEAVIPADA